MDLNKEEQERRLEYGKEERRLVGIKQQRIRKKGCNFCCSESSEEQERKV